MVGRLYGFVIEVDSDSALRARRQGFKYAPVWIDHRGYSVIGSAQQVPSILNRPNAGHLLALKSCRRVAVPPVVRNVDHHTGPGRGHFSHKLRKDLFIADREPDSAGTRGCEG